jgi:hypothetical protein
MNGPALVVIGNPENRRVQFFREAAARLGLPAPQVIAYEALLAGGGQELLERQVPSGALTRPLVRIESPGENAAVAAGLIRRGALLAGESAAAAESAAQVAYERGQIAHANDWYRGFCDLLRELERALASRAGWMNHPADIAAMFDKTASQELLRSRGIAVPQNLLETTGRVPADYDELRALLQQAGWRRAFLKARYGSSASGVVALDLSSRRIQATTSAELVTGAGEARLYNSLRVRCYRHEREVAQLVDALYRDAVHIERWIPKAGLAGRTFDLRVVAIAGEPRHTVMRTSRGPITNLHLGNKRGDLAALFAQWSEPARAAAWRDCSAAAAAFGRSLYCGVDLALQPGLAQHAVLEVNAFGDLLPGVVDAGDDTYTAELRAALGRWLPV